MGHTILSLEVLCFASPDAFRLTLLSSVVGLGIFVYLVTEVESTRTRSHAGMPANGTKETRYNYGIPFDWLCFLKPVKE